MSYLNEGDDLIYNFGCYHCTTCDRPVDYYFNRVVVLCGHPECGALALRELECEEVKEKDLPDIPFLVNMITREENPST